MTGWNQVDAQHAKSYGSHLHRQNYAPRTIYLELTMLIQVANFLIDEMLLPESLRFSLKLQKPTGSDTYYFRSEQVDAMLQR